MDTHRSTVALHDHSLRTHRRAANRDGGIVRATRRVRVSASKADTSVLRAANRAERRSARAFIAEGLAESNCVDLVDAEDVSLFEDSLAWCPARPGSSAWLVWSQAQSPCRLGEEGVWSCEDCPCALCQFGN
jgi:hypothetical protein